jgi:hypothetical protein
MAGFLSIGTNAVIANVAQIGTLKPIFIKNGRAEYYSKTTLKVTRFFLRWIS